MAKFTVQVEDITLFAIEVEATDEAEALNKASEEFYNTEWTERNNKWQFQCDQNFEVVD